MYQALKVGRKVGGFRDRGGQCHWATGRERTQVGNVRGAGVNDCGCFFKCGDDEERECLG